MGKAILALSFLLAVGCSSSSKKTEEPAAAPTDNKTTTAKAVKGAKAVKAAATAAVTGGAAVTCENKEDKRTLEVRSKDGGCELAYTKAGNETVVATANNGTSHCEKVQERIQGNLKNAGFNCQ